MFKKQIVRYIAILLFGFVLLIGCSKSEESSNDVEGSGTSSDGAKVLNVAPDAWMEEKLHLDEAINYFEDKYPDVTVNLKPYPDKDALSTFALKWSKGETDVDIVLTDGLANAVQFLKQDLLIDFDDTNFFEGDTAKDNFVGNTLSYANVNDTQFAIPISLETYAVNINTEMFEEAEYVDAEGNILVPETWEEIYEYAKKLKGDGKEVTSIQWGPNAASMMLATKIAADGTYEKDGVLSYDTPKMREILEIWKKGVDDGVFSVETFTNKDAGRNAYNSGQMAMVLETGAHAAEAVSFIGEGKTDVIPIPGSDINGSRAFTAGILVPKASEEQELAIQFIQEALMNPDIQVAVAEEWGKLPVMKAGFEKIDADWKETLVEIIEISQTAPYYSEYTVIEKNMPMHLQKYLMGDIDLDTFITILEEEIDGIDKDI